jgi:hypothetical protein
MIPSRLNVVLDEAEYKLSSILLALHSTAQPSIHEEFSGSRNWTSCLRSHVGRDICIPREMGFKTHRHLINSFPSRRGHEIAEMSEPQPRCLARKVVTNCGEMSGLHLPNRAWLGNVDRGRIAEMLHQVRILSGRGGLVGGAQMAVWPM